MKGLGYVSGKAISVEIPINPVSYCGPNRKCRKILQNVLCNLCVVGRAVKQMHKNCAAIFRCDLNSHSQLFSLLITWVNFNSLLQKKGKGVHVTGREGP
jgi:hypothetical protein